MQDETTCHPDIRRGKPRSQGRTQFDIDAVVRRPAKRYVPSQVTCAHCGVDAVAFDWYQRVPESDVAPGEPGQDLHFCSMLCLGFYSADQFGGYTPAV